MESLMKKKVQKESLSILFLYRTVPGRMLLKLLIRPGISNAAAAFMSSPASGILIGPFVRKNNIDMERFERPADGYRSFNDFFTRKLKPEYAQSVSGGLVSPCDGLLTVMHIDDDSVMEIKNSRYTVRELLRDTKLSQKYSDGTALIFRLTPSHYHRYCYCAEGRAFAERRIEGVLHCVRPVALETHKVFAQNTREYSVIKTEKYGHIVQMEVGAMLVGRISNHPFPGAARYVEAGEEKGYFEYGGSTIILLFEKGFELCAAIRERDAVDGEIPVTIGESLV